MWTQFMDMHSGGGTKEPPYEYIYIEAPERDAVSIFYSKFGHNPDRVTCTCCGSDYSISEYDTLEHATSYERGCKFVEVRGEEGGGHYVEEHSEKGYVEKYQTLDEYLKKPDILVIHIGEIDDADRKVRVPEQGYVWRD